MPEAFGGLDVSSAQELMMWFFYKHGSATVLIAFLDFRGVSCGLVHTWHSIQVGQSTLYVQGTLVVQ